MQTALALPIFLKRRSGGLQVGLRVLELFFGLLDCGKTTISSVFLFSTHFCPPPDCSGRILIFKLRTLIVRLANNFFVLRKFSLAFFEFLFHLLK